MKTIEFEYQRYWLRVVSLIPILFLFAKIEYDLILMVTDEVNLLMYLAISFIIMSVFVYVVYPRLVKVFLKRGRMEVCGEQIYFIMHNRTQEINVNLISNVEINEVHLYGVKMAQLVLEFEYINKKRKFVFYSEDLKEDDFQKCELFSVYTYLKQRL